MKSKEKFLKELSQLVVEKSSNIKEDIFLGGKINLGNYLVLVAGLGMQNLVMIKNERKK